MNATDIKLEVIRIRSKDEFIFDFINAKSD